MLQYTQKSYRKNTLPFSHLMLIAQRWTTPFNLHPLSLWALAYMLGIWGQAHNMHCILTASLLVFCLCLRFIKSDFFIATTLCCFIFFATGMLRFSLECTPYKTLFATNTKQLYSCSGTVCDISDHQHSYFKKRVTVAIDALSPSTTPAQQIATSGYVHLYVPERDAINYDDQIQIHNLALRKPTSPESLIYTLRNKVVAVHFDANNSYTCTKATHYSWRHYFFDMRTHVTTMVCSKIKRATKPLYTSLFLGNKTTEILSTHRVSQFALWGISHHLARSGLHLVIVIWLWFFFIQRIPLPLWNKQLLLLTLGLLYYLLSWPSLSFDRACLAFILYTFCTWKRANVDSLHAITCVTLFVLLISPAYLLCLDFQLSFGLTWALAWFNHARTKLIPT